MVTHDFLCPKCKKVFEVAHGMFDDRPQKCSICSSIMEKQLSTPIVAKDSSPKTVGHLADQNADTYSSDEKAKMDKEHGIVRKKDPKLWYDQFRTKTREQIRQMDTKAKKKYIAEGK